MDQFNLDDNSEIGTPISKLKNTKNKSQTNNDDLYHLIKDLENRLDDIETSKTIDSLQMNTPSVKKDKKDKKVITQKKVETEISTCNYTELIVFIIIFILINDKFTIETIYKFPFIKNINSPYPNLILRALLFGLLIYLYKRFVK